MRVQFNEKNPNALKENCVDVYIWTSAHNVRDKGESVGHVAIHLVHENIYVSLWPKERVNNPFDVAQPDFMLNYEQDLINEEREPEVSLRFYTLNLEKMKNKFNEYKSSVDGWCLFGGCAENLESCVSLAWGVLEAGGITKLISNMKATGAISREIAHGSSHTSLGSARSNKEEVQNGSLYSAEQTLSAMIKSPDALVAQLKIAHKTENTRYPSVKELNAEQKINQDQKTRSKIECNLM